MVKAEPRVFIECCADAVIRFNRNSPDESQLDVSVRAFPAFPQGRRAALTAVSVPGTLSAVEQPDLAVFLSIWTHSTVGSFWNANLAGRRGRRLRPQLRNQPQNLSEQLPGNGDLGHLEGDVAAVVHHLGADLDQLLLQAR